jgi:DNA-binding MarR family transcriptional regulator/N-acetylglutamate synthase-like GNAT family acetyltransferase
MTTDLFEQRIAAVRRFSRFYTRQLGLLQESLVHTRFSLTEARVLYELAHREQVTASALAADLDLDHGYLSRILRRFGEEGLLKKARAPADGRQSLLTITAKGRKAFAPLNKGSHDQVAELLGGLNEPEQARVVGAMATVEAILGDRSPQGVLLRPHRPGDMGWVTSAHGALYAGEYGWDISFEALVAKIAAEFIENFNPAREHCWIAELDGSPVGSVFVVRKTDAIAKLRLLIVDRQARGLGLGKRLVEECLRFAKGAGYSSMTLWTQSCLTAARGIYQRAGFKLVAEEPHHSFGVDLIGETWERDL